MLAFGRLLERAAHDEGPWRAVAYGCEPHPFPLTRELIEDGSQIVFTGYLRQQCDAIYSVGIFLRGQLVTAQDITGRPSSPCRITLALGVADPEMAG
jgi:hypothetical protein